MSHWKSLRKDTSIDLKLFDAYFEYLINPRNKKEVKIVRLSGPDACNVITITEDGRLLFVRQFRFGTNEYTLEVPGGLMEEGEDQLHSAKRELVEETGYTAPVWKYLSSVPSNPVYLDCYIHHWVAEGAVLTDATKMDDAEDLEIVLLKVEEIVPAMRSGLINHPHTISALMAYFLTDQNFRHFFQI
jgi:ADP-ribose pyrophosphatase